MATYVNDLRLKEIATGDESGTWGTSTNTNLELIAEAFLMAQRQSLPMQIRTRPLLLTAALILAVAFFSNILAHWIVLAP